MDFVWVKFYISVSIFSGWTDQFFLRIAHVLSVHFILERDVHSKQPTQSLAPFLLLPKQTANFPGLLSLHENNKWMRT